MSQSMKNACSRRLRNAASPTQAMANESTASTAPLQENEVQDQVVNKADVEDPLQKANPGPKEGCMVSVRVQHDNRLLDRNRHWDDRFMRLAHRGLVINTDAHEGGSRTARGIVYDHAGHGLTYAGLVNIPGLEADDFVSRSIIEEEDAMGKRKDVTHPSEDACLPTDKKSELVPSRDFVSCTPPMCPDSTTFELQVLHRDATFGKLVRLEIDAKTPEMCERWVAAIMKSMQDEMRAGLENFNPSMPSFHPSSFVPHSSFQPRTCATPLMEWLDWIRFPVRSLLRATIPDTHRPHMRKYYPIAFMMSMFWLAVFAFAVTEICEELHKYFGISNNILGMTVAAVGTSFPNVISCIAVSRQGRTGMAIANALGANIQNVFLALAIPWIIRSATQGGRFCADEAGLSAAVMWMFGTLGCMVVIVLFAGCRMPKWAGAAFLVIYAAYFIMQLMSELTDCPTWPIGC